VLVTAGVVFASVLFLVSLLPHQWVGHAEWVQHVAKELLAVPVASIGVSFFWVPAKVLGRFGFRLLRRPGEVQTVAIAFGLLLSLLGVPLSLAALVLLVGFPGKPLGTLRGWEAGRGIPNLPALLRLARALGVPPERFAEGAGPFPSPEILHVGGIG
jgi:hypothetical protein